MEAERQAINSPVQSTASDLMLLAMVHLHKELNPHEAGMVITQHDEIGFEIREDMAGEYMPVIKEVMETLPLKSTFGLDLNIPIVADVEAADHWPGIPDASGLGITDY
jgi:DNA polymerase-1